MLLELIIYKGIGSDKVLSSLPVGVAVEFTYLLQLLMHEFIADLLDVCALERRKLQING